MARLRHDKSGRITPVTSPRAVPASGGTRKQKTSRSGLVTTNQPKPAVTEPTCCGLVLPKNGKCSVCSD